MPANHTCTIALAAVAIGVLGCADVLGIDAGRKRDVTAAGGAGGEGASDVGGSSGGEGGVAGSGGEPAVGISDDGLLARYFMDEAGDGVSPTQLIDVTGSGNLTIDYSTTVSWTNVDGNRGLVWVGPGRTGRAFAPILDTGVRQLANGTQLTIELVVAISDLLDTCSRVVHIGGGGAESGTASLCATPNEVQVRHNDTIRNFAVSLSNVGRTVVHMVVDVEALADDRAFLYVDAKVPVRAIPRLEPTPFFGFDDNDIIAIGNRVDDRSVRGRIHYVAIYEQAFSPERVAQHHAALVLGDDAGTVPTLP